MARSQRADAPSTRRVALLLGLLVALTIIGSSAVAVALPEVARDLGLDTAGTAWVLAAFSLTFSVATAVFGRLADVQGLRRALVVGLALFTAGSLLAGAAPSFRVLVFGRLVQGAGAGAVPVLALGVLAARFGGRARAKALGALTGVVSVVSGSGPLIGGTITAALGWRAVLALPAVAALIGVPVARLAPHRPVDEGAADPDRPPETAAWQGVPARPPRRSARRPPRRVGAAPRGFDVRGAVAVAVTVTGATLLLQTPATGLGAGGAVVFAGVAAVGAGGAAWQVRHRPGGFLPAVVARDRGVTVSAGVGLTLLAAYIGMMLALPLLLEAEFGWSPLQIGAALVPAAACGAVASRAAGAVVPRVGSARLVAVVAAGSVVGVLLAAAGPERPAVLVAGMALVVVGFAAGQVALIDRVSTTVDEAVRGIALGVFNLVFFVGGAVGAATVGGLSSALTLRGALVCLAVLPLGGALAALTLRR